MGLFKIWKDHVTQFSNRYKEINNADGTITHEAVEGEVIQEGTPQNAKNFNDMEQRILAAGEVAGLAMLKVGAVESKVEGLAGEIIETTLTNSKEYPFNNSKKTLALKTPRGNLDYTVFVESSTEDAGGIGEIKITDKQLNGFKIEFTGAAKEVSVKCTVQGANVIIKNDERKAQTAAVLNAYGVGGGRATAAQREAAEHIAVRSNEAYRELQRMGGKR